MKLSEAIRILKHSELNTLAIKDNEEAIISFINLALVELYNQFELNITEHVYKLCGGTTVYDLPEDFMYFRSAFYTKGKETHEVAVNGIKSKYSIHSISFDKLQVPFACDDACLSVIYVTKPPELTRRDLDTELPVPSQLLQALFAYVAYKGHGAVVLDGQHEGDIYFLRFQRLCDDIKKRGTGTVSDSFDMVTRLHDRGFP